MTVLAIIDFSMLIFTLNDIKYQESGLELPGTSDFTTFNDKDKGYVKGRDRF